MNIREQLLRDEGLKLKVYRDSLGILTIGVGRNLEHKGITKAEAMQLLDNDIAEVTRNVEAAFQWWKELDYCRQMAIVNLAFNIGIGGVAGFKMMIAALKRKDFNAAAVELLDSKYAQQVGARAGRVAAQIREGVWK